MAQFDVYRNASASKEAVPYLLDIQNDMLDHLKTRVVIPLVALDHPATHLNPAVEIEGRAMMLSTQEMAGVPVSVLGERVVSLAERRDELVHAVDFLVTGF
jgi:toxin CcdB